MQTIIIGMCVDGAGNIAVCDFKNNRVTLLSPDGVVIGHALTSLSRPQFVAMTANHLYTLDMGRSMSYRYGYCDLYIS